MDVQPQLNDATIAEESSLLHYYRRFSRPIIGPKSPIAHSVESDKQLSEGLKTARNRRESRIFTICYSSLLPVVLQNGGLKKRGDYMTQLKTGMRLKNAMKNTLLALACFGI